MAFALSARSLFRLSGVHPDLVRVVKNCITISPVDFGVIEGLRTPDAERRMVATGKSLTMNSRHLTGHAVDLCVFVGGVSHWDWALYVELNDAMQKAAKLEDVPVEWGGQWTKPKDGDHWQLPWAQYPLRGT
jgi:peptidoglycan L-alanyl-D-glutamate endopeptidase CwlK